MLHRNETSPPPDPDSRLGSSPFRTGTQTTPSAFGKHGFTHPLMPPVSGSETQFFFPHVYKYYKSQMERELDMACLSQKNHLGFDFNSCEGSGGLTGEDPWGGIGHVHLCRRT